jgi:hypothetical protein
MNTSYSRYDKTLIRAKSIHAYDTADKSILHSYSFISKSPSNAKTVNFLFVKPRKYKRRV